MNTSYTKKRKIQEANAILEKRLIMELTESGTTTTTVDENKKKYEKAGKLCATTGELADQSYGIKEEKGYHHSIDGKDYLLFIDYAALLNVDPETFKNTYFLYKCDNNKPVIYSFCDSKSTEFKGKTTDLWEYKILTDVSNNSIYPFESKNVYCTRKKGSNNWALIHPVTTDNPKMYKAYNSIDKLYNSQKNNPQNTSTTNTSTADNQNTSTTNTSPVGSYAEGGDLNKLNS